MTSALSSFASGPGMAVASKGRSGDVMTICGLDHPEDTMDALFQDVRFALRSFRRNPGFALAAVVTLCVGIGSTTAIFSVVDGVILRPLPYDGANRAVALWQNNRGAGIERDDVSSANFIDWKERSTRFERMAAIEPNGLDWLGPEGPQELSTWMVTRDFFEILGTRPILGRTLQPQDYQPGAPTAVMLGFSTWRDRFGADSSVVGNTITLDETPVMVAGVLPVDFQYPPNGEVWAPRAFTEGARQQRAANYFMVVGRLAPGVPLGEAQAEMDAIGAQLAAEYPDTNAEIGVSVVPLAVQVLGSVRPAMFVLLASVVVLLLIACVNVANLVLARGTQRGRELAMRATLGASRPRMVGQLAVESLVLALVGGGLGTVLASWGVASLRSVAPAGLPRIESVTVDLRVLGFALAVTVLTSVLVGFGPLLRVARSDLREQLSDTDRGSSGGRGPVRLQDTLVVGQIGLALILLSGAGLLGRSFVKLLQQDPGFVTEHVVAFTTQAWRFYPDAPGRAGFVRVATETLEQAPGVVAAGMTSSLPLAGTIYADRATFTVIGQPEPRPGQEPSARGAAVTSGYFEALGIPLTSGRLFRSTDDQDAPAVVVISETLARRHFGAKDPVGERLLLTFAGPPVPAEVIGVVGDVRHQGLDDPPGPALYLPHAQHPTGAITFTVRTTAPISTALAGLKEQIWALNPRISLTDTGSLEGLLSDTLRQRRFYLLLLGVFASVALFLAVIGIYGLISYAARRRVAEIGIRLALGAQARTILALFLSRAGVLVAIGVGTGLGGSLLLTRYLGSLLYEIQPNDPVTLLGVAVLLAGVAITATWVPARRASRIEPASTLRGE